MFKANPNGFHVTFDNGYTVSVQWGFATYSDNHGHRDYSSASKDSRTAEVAVKDSRGKWEDDIRGYLSPSDVLALMNEVASR